MKMKVKFPAKQYVKHGMNIYIYIVHHTNYLPMIPAVYCAMHKTLFNVCN